MANVHDVAAHILNKQRPMSTWKLQKLVYYSQAWHLAWEEEPLFEEPIQAWANGPVVRALYDQHRGAFSVTRWDGDARRLTKEERATINAVLDSYGGLSGRQLSILTHQERPWREARSGLDSTARSAKVIPPEAMQTFYAALDADEGARAINEIDWV